MVSLLSFVFFADVT